MDCRRFRQSHSEFLDGLTDDRQTGEMYEHLRSCERCSRFDTAMRRGLLVARNLPPIRPSKGFRPRLEARLRAPAAPAASHRYSVILTGVAAGVAIAMVVMLVSGGRQTRGSSIPTATATAAADPHALVPAPTPMPRPTSAQFMASLASGIPVWPGVSIADHAAAHLEQVELHARNGSP